MPRQSLAQPVYTKKQAEFWAPKLWRQWDRSTAKIVEELIKVGRMFLKAKAALPHGEWGRLFEGPDARCTVRTAERFIAIALHPILSNATHVSHLPTAWGTLYELTKVDHDMLTYALADGRIHPAMERRDVAKLLPPKPAARTQPMNLYAAVQAIPAAGIPCLVEAAPGDAAGESALSADDARTEHPNRFDRHPREPVAARGAVHVDGHGGRQSDARRRR
jgi:hypothetical protein